MQLWAFAVRIRAQLGTTLPVLLASLLALSGSAAGEGSSTSARRSARVARCTDAAIREVTFSHDVTVDEIRVELHSVQDGAADEQGPVLVQLTAGRFARQLPVAPHLGRGLRFSPGLTSDRFTVTLDPSFATHGSACVSRVALLHDGQEVASLAP